MNLPEFQGLEHLSTAVILLDEHFRISHLNPAAENLFEISLNHVHELPLNEVFGGTQHLMLAAGHALDSHSSFTEHELNLSNANNTIAQVSCTVTPVDAPPISLLLEFNQIDKQLKIVKEERMLLQQQANQELLRNLAHEIKNPLGGLRGAAQLLELELPKPELKEYTQVIIKESDRLQSLMDRLLTPHRLPKYRQTNIHEVLERVRSLLLAEYGIDASGGVTVRRDYDTSLPEILADQEQLIQTTLNIARNAVQAMGEQGELRLRTRIARQVTLAKKRYRLALVVQIIDNGPGIPEYLREKIFYPLVSGREGGSGLGLSLAQTFVAQHHGLIECDSQPGHTCFTITLPVTDTLY